MKGHEGKTLHHCAWAVLLLGACSKAPESPVAKTNPNPKQRYEITVELVDPPPDIREISGVAHFGVSTRACLPYQEKIARVTIGASYKREFALIRAGESTYKGHIFLDWPIDQDYYGLGVCKWEITGVNAILARGNELTQTPRLTRTEVTSQSRKVSYCRKDMRDKYDFSCFTPIDEALIKELDAVSYKVRMSSIKD